MGWYLILAGTFVVGLALEALFRHGHAWILALGLVIGFVLSFIGARADRHENLEGGSALAAILVALLVGSWSLGVAAGYPLRRIARGSI
jgi:uncharacterized membrane protein YccC